MNIEQCFLTVNKYSRPGKKLNKIKGIVIHWISVPYQKPEQTARFFEDRKNGKTSYGSAHFIIGLEGEILQVIPTDERAYHVGADSYTALALERLSTYPNNCTIGIEMCHTEKGFEDATVNSTVKLVASLCKENGLTKDYLYRHYDITGKDCPKFYVDDERKWGKFKKLVSQKKSEM